MKCPACGGNLTQINAGDLELDACSGGCGGIWFDRDEIFKMDEKHEFDSHPVLALAEGKSSPGGKKPKECPKCPGEIMGRQFFDVENKVEIDQCYNCSGVWLDVGELQAIRSQYATYADRAAAVNEYVDKQLAENRQRMKKEVQEQIRAYNEETRNIFTSFLFGFKKLLGAEDLSDGL